MAERSSSLLSLPEYTLTYILFLSFDLLILTVLPSKPATNIIFFPFFFFLPYQICGLVNTLNLIDSHHLSVYVWLFPSVLVVYLYIKCDVREARISTRLLRDLWKENHIIPKPPCLSSSLLIMLLPSGSVSCGLVCIAFYHYDPNCSLSHSVIVLSGGLWIMMTVWKV